MTIRVFLFCFILLTADCISIKDRLQVVLNKQQSNSTASADLSKVSFLETKIDAESTSTMKEALGLKVQKKRRKTKDGRNCASAFVQDGKTFYDCTSTKSPDGKMTEKEWCYVDPKEGGSPNWDFCEPVLDFDTIRRHAAYLLNEMVPEIRRVTELVFKQIPPASKTLDTFETIRRKQSQVDPKVTALVKAVEVMNNNYNTLMQLKAKWEDLEKKIKKVQEEVEQLKKAKPELSPMNCEGILGYEEEADGDGINTLYFNNENFIGTPVKHVSHRIHFDWTGENPLPEISHENFSVEWSGYLKIPVTGGYRFISETDDGNSFMINEQLVLSHKMPDEKTGSWLATEASNPSDPKADKSISKEVMLIGGNKYPYKFKCYHSVHTNYHETGASYARLSWKSTEFSERIIDDIFYYRTKKTPPLKITGYTSAHFVLGTMREFDNAFKDSPFMKMADIPLQFLGLNQLKSLSTWTLDAIELSTTAAVSLYMAVNMLQGNPLPDEFQDTQEVMSLLLVPKAGKGAREIRAKKSLPFRIYKRDFPTGEFKIPIAFRNPKNPTTSFILFYALNPLEANQGACGGTERNIGLDGMDGCSASSTLNGYKCDNAFKGEMTDTPKGVWASSGEGIGAWVEVKFKQDYQVTAIEFKNRDNAGERNKKIDMEFSKEQKQSGEVKNTDKVANLGIKPVITRFVRFTIAEVYGTMNNGGAFNIFGVPCKTEIEEKAESDEPETVISLKCENSIVNNEDLARRGLKEGDEFKVTCPACSNDDAKIYGDRVYSDDSSICKAAAHMGALPPSGGEVTVKVMAGENSYKGENKNGITSESKGTASSSISFIKAIDASAAEANAVFVGMKVDSFDPKLKQWLKGFVKEVKREGKKAVTITVGREGYGEDFDVKEDWFNREKVDYCGSRLAERECDEKSKKQEQNPPLDIKIAFTPDDKSVDGYVVDKGEIFGKHGAVEYGWTRDMTNMARHRMIHPDKLLDNLVLFPPDQRSQWCNTKEPIVPCEPASWKMKVKNGKYNIKLTCGDPTYKAMYWVKVNKIPFISGEILAAKQYYTPQHGLEVLDGQIEITNDCQGDCSKTWSRVNAIEIKELPKDHKLSAIFDAKGTQNMGCGNAFKGGRCSDGSDPSNCVWNGANDPGVEKCSGILHLVRIPSRYECKEQRMKYKCIKSKSDTVDECKKSCPGECRGVSCSVPPIY